MVARYIHDGSAIDYRPTADVAAGDVIQLGNIFGIARLDIKAGELGSLATYGVYDIPKPTNSGYEFGASVRWDVEKNIATTAAAAPIIGIVVGANETTDTTLRVLINTRTANT